MKIDHKESYRDFGDQFLTDKDIGGYWGSIELLKEIVFPFDLNLIKDKKIMDVGIGSGRISNNLLKYEPSKLVAVEPSEAINIAKDNIKSDKVESLVNTVGHQYTVVCSKKS
jgi:predicted RNA methylase